MKTNTPAIKIAGLTKSYGDQHVLKGLDLDVVPGSILALLGSNGAGKTTAVKILSTLLKADGGTVEVNGFDVATQAAEVRASISLTGQFAAVDEILTGHENLVLVAELRRVANPRQVADELLLRFDLADARITWNPALTPDTEAALDHCRAFMLEHVVHRSPTVSFDYGKRTQSGIVSPVVGECETFLPEIEAFVSDAGRPTPSTWCRTTSRRSSPWSGSPARRA